MTDYYIFRHGDTSDSEQSTFHIITNFFKPRRDTHDLEILPKGIPALEKTGEFLKKIKTDADFCSPYPRCVKSAEIVGKIAGKKYKEDARIRELENKGESFGIFKKRVENFLDEIESKNYKAVSICTHGAVIAALKHLKGSGGFYFFQVVDYPEPGILTKIVDGKITQIDFNNS